MSTISSRHEGDLDGRLVPFSENRKTSVSIILDTTSEHIAVQHTAWMLCNLLARLDGYVERISICSPSGIPVQPFVFPFQYDQSDFKTILVCAAASLGIVPVVSNERIGMLFYVGPGSAVEDGWRVYGAGWCGGVTKSSIEMEALSRLPFGPYTAACFAASEVFKTVRMRPEHYLSSGGFYNVWNLQPTLKFQPEGPAELEAREINCTLAGVGAVGNSFLHTISACPTLKFFAVLADNDPKGIEVTNLNRYVLFGKNAIGSKKPDAACVLLKQEHMRLTPWNDSVEKLDLVRERVLSAVDTNKARESIQVRYPSRIISASTLDLRAEVFRCGPPGKGACLRCFNPPEKLPSDDALILKLRKANPAEFSRICQTANVSEADAQSWIKTKKCGEAGESLLGVLREEDEQSGAFAVGFTSVLAGVLLAAELIKDCAGVKSPLNDAKNRAVFQFFDVMSEANDTSFIARDVDCPLCNPQRAALKIWERRFCEMQPIR